MPIRVLPPEVADKIAAGEVVERPASVVKELVENALDAGATQVRVEIREGGLRLIKVTDNGSGIPAAEVPLAVQRHATSKIASAADLAAIRTLGFRGEALAAIASVSRLTLTTRYRDEATGTRLVVEGGRVLHQEPAAHPVGTTVQVEHLFFNTPARRKFLKTPRTEAGHISRMVQRFAFGFPDVRFTLVSDGRVVLRTGGSGRLADVVATLWGTDVAREMVGVGPEVPPWPEAGPEPVVWGLVGKPNVTRPNAQHILFFLNRRWITDRALQQAVLQAYHTFMPAGRYPLAVVHIVLDPAQVDVNVHPTKAEVRFRRPRVVFAAVQKAVRAALVGTAPARPVALEVTWAQAPGWAERGERLRAARGEEKPLPLVPEGDSPAADASPSREASAAGLLPLLRVVGQVGAAYIVAEGPDGLYLIDQHAAHERVLYEQLQAQWLREGHLPAQHLLNPVPVTVDSDLGALLSEHEATLRQMGFIVETFGPGTYLIRAVPAVLSQQNPAQALEDILEGLREDRDRVRETLEERLILHICKRAAVKAGQVLSEEEMRALVRDLEACATPHTCPHGRPTLIHISAADLARQFGRE